MDRLTPHGTLRALDNNHAGTRDSESGRDFPIVSTAADCSRLWLLLLRRYFAFVVVANLVWETVQLPLYTIWSEGTVGEIAFAIVHCTAGDILIASASLLGALLLVGNSRWPLERFGPVTCLAVAVGLSYTIFNEWLNTEIRGSWAYTDFMPTLPLIGSSLSPLAQWIVVPLAAFWWARHSVFRTGQSLGATG